MVNPGQEFTEVEVPRLTCPTSCPRGGRCSALQGIPRRPYLCWQPPDEGALFAPYILRRSLASLGHCPELTQVGTGKRRHGSPWRHFVLSKRVPGLSAYVVTHV